MILTAYKKNRLSFLFLPIKDYTHPKFKKIIKPINTLEIEQVPQRKIKIKIFLITF